MSAPAWLVLAFLGLVTSARIRLSAVIIGHPCSVPVLLLAAVVVVLVLAVAVLWLVRIILRDWPRPRAVSW